MSFYYASSCITSYYHGPRRVFTWLKQGIQPMACRLYANFAAFIGEQVSQLERHLRLCRYIALLLSVSGSSIGKMSIDSSEDVCLTFFRSMQLYGLRSQGALESVIEHWNDRDGYKGIDLAISYLTLRVGFSFLW